MTKENAGKDRICWYDLGKSFGIHRSEAKRMGAKKSVWMNPSKTGLLKCLKNPPSNTDQNTHSKLENPQYSFLYLSGETAVARIELMGHSLFSYMRVATTGQGIRFVPNSRNRNKKPQVRVNPAEKAQLHILKHTHNSLYLWGCMIRFFIAFAAWSQKN